jgi:hypothetical protein
MPTSPPPSDDTPKHRLRGDMYLRAERQHLAEVAAARLLETTTPVTSTLPGARPPDEPPRAAPESAVIDIARFESESDPVPDPPATPVGRGYSTAASVVRNFPGNPLASFRSETQADLRLVKPTPSAKPTSVNPAPSVKPVPSEPVRTAAPKITDVRAFLPVAALGALALAGLIAIVLSSWPARNTGGVADSTIARSDSADVTASGAQIFPSASSGGTSPSTRSSAGSASASAAPSSSATAATGENPLPVPTANASDDTSAVTPSSVGQLRITSSPNGARVTINGIGWGQTPVTVRNLPLGTKTLRLTSDGYTSQQRTVELGGGFAAIHVALKRHLNR